MGETFAVDTKDFWAKVGALNFPALFKNIGKTMKESGTLPLSLASFDGENPVWVQMATSTGAIIEQKHLLMMS